MMAQKFFNLAVIRQFQVTFQTECSLKSTLVLLRYLAPISQWKLMLKCKLYQFHSKSFFCNFPSSLCFSGFTAKNNVFSDWFRLFNFFWKNFVTDIL